MRVGGFLINGEYRLSLGRCAESLAAVADTCVAVSTGESPLSERILLERGFRVERKRWEGYGAARAAAVELLGECDYVFFLDSDEWLEPAAIAQLRAWRESAPTAPHYALRRRDWAEFQGRRFRYRSENHVRLVRKDVARWKRTMIVHEALPAATRVKLPVHIEHLFADDLEAMWSKVDRYALLWALRFHGDSRPVKSPAVQHLVHFVRETIVKGALFRGGIPALQLASAVAHHHAQKYQFLRMVRAGAHAELRRAFEEGRMADLYRLLPPVTRAAERLSNTAREAGRADKAVAPRQAAGSGGSL